jgi:hypothetical protein
MTMSSLSIQDKIDFIAGRIWSLQTWLQDHGRSSKKPRPEHDIEQRERSLQMFEAIQSDYLASQARRSA